MKINYKGQELETITDGYWPDGVTLVCWKDDFEETHRFPYAICLRNGYAFGNAGERSLRWRYWAILPPKPAARRLTNREAFELCRKGYDALYRGDVARYFIYPLAEENEAVCEYCEKLRAPGSDEWVEPTTDLLEVGG